MDYVAYRRVSSRKQGQSGLGLEAQDAAIRAYVGEGKILAVYTEVESGKRADRPQLAAAMAHARRAKAQLVVAKLDRLSRSLVFMANLMESGVDFVCCDSPNVNRLTIGVLSVFAEDEARRISERTKGALAAYKARGGVLGAARPGAPHLSQEARQKGVAASVATRQEQAREAYTDILPFVKELREQGLSLRQIAARLDSEGHATRTGKAWNPVQVSALLKMAG